MRLGEKPELTGKWSRRKCLYEMYLPAIGARRFFAAAGITLRSIKMGGASAEPHLQARSSPSERTASRIARCTLSAFFVMFEMISSSVTVSCCGGQQPESVITANEA